MSKLAGFLLAVSVLLVPLVGVAQQTCRSESEIPSSTPTGRFTDHGDGTLTDIGSGLMWARCAAGLSGTDCAQGSAGTYTWQGALDYAAASELAGNTNWRLPNVSELRSIVEQRCYDPSVNPSVFPHTPAWYFWSASPVVLSSETWSVNFYDGEYNYDSPRAYGRLESFHVRLVRTGQ